MTDVPFVRASGTPFAVGHAHGAALAGRLRGFLDDGLTRLDRLLPAPRGLAELAPAIDAHRAVIEEDVPALAEEVRGLAAGAGLTEREAWLLQVRREVLGYSKIPTMGDCTTYGRAADGVLAQTVDLNGDLDDQIAVLHVAGRAGPDALVLSFGGLLGYLGVNSAGLAVGLNLVLGGDWTPGVPPYLAIRHLLDTARGAAEAVELLRGMRLSSSRSLTLLDGDELLWVEVLDGELRTHRAPETVHANHFLHPDFTPSDELNPFAANSSHRRHAACAERLASLPPAADAESHFAVLAAPPIRVPDHGDVRRERTVAAVVLDPAAGTLHLRPGDPALTTTRTFHLTPTAAPAAS
ncbi:C45 family autoproteolytic acyltransferase/hydolase [Actinomadura flavalba]|uniref:C45 family autoproteolytic acyltransferase/hydolase n=1 Tax=Actinomadura flavalba TaxID=1120938 RepID=UPI00037659B4|nr:C45 family peptidase [Actinomadura flavalba]